MSLHAVLMPSWPRPLRAVCRTCAIKRQGLVSVGDVVQKRRYFTPVTLSEDPADGDGREKVVILGSGWAGFVLSRRLDPDKYRIVVVSPRSYFVFTPLLNDTCVGTLEFRNVLESVRKRNRRVEFIQAWADDISFADKTVTVESSVLDPDVGHALTGPRKATPEKPRAHGAASLEGFIDKDVQLGGTGKYQAPTFPVRYDKLIIAVGTYSQTFNTKGVRENAYFLKDVGDAVAIRRRVLELFELARLPIVAEDKKRMLLHFAIVGGGPTGMEFAACLSDLIREDISRIHPELLKYIRISLYDVAPKVLPMFDAALADYAVKQYKRQNVEIKTSHHVEELRKGFPNDADAAQHQADEVPGLVYTIRTKEEGDVGIGMCVWSTGLMANPFVAKALSHVHRFPTASADITQGGAGGGGEVAAAAAAAPVDALSQRQWSIQRDPRSGSILVDDHFRVHLSAQPVDGETDETVPQACMKDVFAVGDTAKLITGALPATAQVANQEALWLGKALSKSPDYESFAQSPGFTFRNLGVFTYVGGAKAVLQGPNTTRDGLAKGLRGWIAFLVWRGAYLTMTLSWRNKFLVPMQWLAVKLFGRDISRF